MIGPYKRSKFAAEAVVRDMIAERGLPAVIVNPSTPIGPGDIKPDPDRAASSSRRRRARCRAMSIPGSTSPMSTMSPPGICSPPSAARSAGATSSAARIWASREILAEVARATGRRPPRLKVPYAVVLPVAAGAEAVARLTGREPFVTLDGARMSRKKMYFTSARAERELGYAPRPARDAIADAVAWFTANGYLK